MKQKLAFSEENFFDQNDYFKIDMRNYKTTSKLFGYNIGLNNDNLYIAVPKKYLGNGSIQVTCDGESKVFKDEDVAQEVTLKDKFDQEVNYTLCYFLWRVFDENN